MSLGEMQYDFMPSRPFHHFALSPLSMRFHCSSPLSQLHTHEASCYTKILFELTVPQILC